MKYDLKMGAEEKARVEALKARRTQRRKERAEKVGPLTAPYTNNEFHTNPQSPLFLEERTQGEETQEIRRPVHQWSEDGYPPSSGNTGSEGIIHPGTTITSPLTARSAFPHANISPLRDGGEGKTPKKRRKGLDASMDLGE